MPARHQPERALRPAGGASPFPAAACVAPLIIGIVRRVPDVGAVAAISMLLGWAFAGWVLALALAMRLVAPARPAVRIVRNLRPGGWQGLGGARPPWSAPPLMLPPPSDMPDPADWE
jgi:hypothetical protein